MANVFSLTFLLQARWCLVTGDCSRNFGCFEVTEDENIFSRLSLNESELLKNKLYHDYFTCIAYQYIKYERKTVFHCGRWIFILLDIFWHPLLIAHLNRSLLRIPLKVSSNSCFTWTVSLQKQSHTSQVQVLPPRPPWWEHFSSQRYISRLRLASSHSWGAKRCFP